MIRARKAIAVFILCSIACVASEPERVKVENCKLEGIDAHVQCAYLQVPENWDKPQGKTIGLRAVIFPSAQASRDKVAIFHVEGGPGISPVDAAAKFYATDGKPYWNRRDLVLLEQRGTGESNPLSCPELEKRSQLEEAYPPELVARCRKRLETNVDLTQYDSLAAVRDLDAVRKLLGYPKIDFWAQSYGTRVALLYLDHYPENVHAMVLQASVAVNAKLPLYHAANAELVLNRVYEQCQHDPKCHAAYPDISKEWLQFLKKLPEAQRGIVAEVIRKTMYTTDGLRRLPYLIHQLYLARSIKEVLGSNGDGPPDLEGAYLSIICKEDVPRITSEAERKETENTSFGNYRIEQQKKACRQWFPTPPKLAGQFNPVKSGVPVLFLVGTMDAVTPPAWSFEQSRTLVNSRVITIPEMGHQVGGLTSLDCYDRITVQFLDTADPLKIDTSCIETMKAPEFFIEP